MNSSRPLQIWGAKQELDSLRRKKKKEGLNALERDDYPYLKKFVKKYHRQYLRLDSERREVFEIWREFLYDQRTMSGALITSEVFAVLDKVLPARLTPESYMRVFRLIKQIDEIVVRYNKTEKKNEQEEGEE